MFLFRERVGGRRVADRTANQEQSQRACALYETLLAGCTAKANELADRAAISATLAYGNAHLPIDHNCKAGEHFLFLDGPAFSDSGPYAIYQSPIRWHRSVLAFMSIL